MPKVSICIPTCDHAEHLRESIESVLSQSFTNFELIIIDDDSMDYTKDIVSDYLSRDERITFKANQKKLGMVENWNRCIHKSRGKYVKVLSNGFFPSTDALRPMVEVLDSDPRISLLASAGNVIGAGGEIVDSWSNFLDGVVLSGFEVIKLCLHSRKNLIGEPGAALFRRTDASRGFLARYRQVADLEFWIYLLEQGRFAYIDSPFVSIRKYSGRQNIGSLIHFEQMHWLISDYFWDKRKAYLQSSWLERIYAANDFHYEIWRKYKKRREISREVAVQKIQSCYSLRCFFLLYPLYKLARPIVKLKKSLARFWERRSDLKPWARPKITLNSVNQVTQPELFFGLKRKQKTFEKRKRFIDIQPLAMVASPASCFEALSEYEISSIGKGLGAIHGVIDLVFRNKIGCRPTWNESIWEGCVVIQLLCELRDAYRGGTFDILRPSCINDISPQLALRQGPDRVADIERYARALSSGVTMPPPLYTTGGVLNLLGAAVDDYELYMLDGVRRLIAQALNHQRNATISVIIRENDFPHFAD